MNTISLTYRPVRPYCAHTLASPGLTRKRHLICKWLRSSAFPPIKPTLGTAEPHQSSLRLVFQLIYPEQQITTYRFDMDKQRSGLGLTRLGARISGCMILGKAAKLPASPLYTRVKSFHSLYFRVIAERSHVSLSLCFVFSHRCDGSFSKTCDARDHGCCHTSQASIRQRQLHGGLCRTRIKWREYNL
jgi:hypothetical protein